MRTLVKPRPRLTRSGVVGLQSHVDRLRSELDEYRELMSDPRRDERVVLELERLMAGVDELEALIAESVVVDEVDLSAGSVVGIGTRLRVGLSDGSSEVVRVVHAAEAFLDDERVSVEAPLARAVLGLTVGEQGQVVAPAGALGFTVAVP